jgi:Zn finger protein HypA/HybF involved in hydrogenase expression
MLAEAQALSLRDVGIPSGSNSNALEPPRDRRRRERSRDQSRDSRRSRDDRRSRSRQSPERSPTRVILPPRAIEHQSSLRSLLSSSEIDSEEVDEDLVRQVLEELVSEGVDLSQIGPSQEEEITERIAEAVRRRQSERHAERQRERRERRERLAREGLTSSSATSLPQPLRSPLVREEEAARRRPHGRPESGTSTPQTATGPPISRPGLIDAANRYRDGSARHQRSSSQGSSRSARRLERPAALSVSSRPTYNDAERPATSDPSTLGSAPAPMRRQSDQGQRSGIDARQQFRNSLQTSISPSASSPRGLGFNIPTSGSPTSSLAIVGTPAHSPSTSTPAITPFQPPGSRRTTDPAGARQRPNSNHGTPPLASALAFLRSTTDPVANESRSRQDSVSVPLPPVLYTEPQISCKHCGKEHIEHELHYHCSRCDDGAFDLCHRCYRAGKGCKHWFGFGWTAWARYENNRPEGGYPPGYEQPHVLTGHRYRTPLTPLTESSTPPHVLMSEDDPEHRLEEGVFCDSCKAFANACYWKCDYCNEGDWGFCNDCVNQGKHCTHPLLPVAHQPRNANNTSTPSTPRLDTGLSPPDVEITANTPPRTPKAASFIRGPDYATISNLVFRPLNFTTLCNICRHSIPPSNTRYHCLKCNAGDYDICMACYHKLNVSGRITKEDGINGWRKCPRGHRMVVIGFEDRDGGQRRMVVRDLVGGYMLKEETDDASSGTRSPTTGTRVREWKWRDDSGTVHNYRAPLNAAVPAHRFPPDGGVGLRLRAKWNYQPEDGVKDELAFPRHGEIREAVEMNADWYWGVYCGATGLLPASFVAGV